MAIRMMEDNTHLPKRTSTRFLARASHTAPESEKTLEARLRKEVEKRGGQAFKLMSQMHRGLPDRLILMPGGRAYFAEMKSTGKNPTELQSHCHGQLRALGFIVFVIDSTETLQEALSIIDANQKK